MNTPTREEMAIAIIKQRPGITPIRLAICLDMQVYETREGGKRAGGRRGMNRRVTRFIDSLERRGVVIKRRDPFATKANDYKIYPADHQFPEKKLFEPAKDIARYQCKTIRVPVDQIHLYTPENAMKNQSANQSAYDRHLAKVRGTSAPAPTPPPTAAPQRQRINPEPNAPELPTEPAEGTPDDVSVLKAEIERLRAEIDRLQQESDPADQIIQEMSDRATYVEWLQAEELKWRLTARRYAEELSLAQKDLDSAIANAEACSRLLSLVDGEPTATYANGHRELLEEVGE